MNIVIKGEIRDQFGKNASRRIRREGNLPAILYGPATENFPLILNKKDVFQILKSESGENTLFKIDLGSQKRDVMIKAFQQDVVSDEVLHIDLIQIAMDKIIRVMVSMNVQGEAIGVKSEGGFVDVMTRELEIECLPHDIPEHIDIDISDLHINQSLKVEDLPEIKGVKLLADPNQVLVVIASSKVEEEAEEEEVEGIIGEEEEPELIKKEQAKDEKKEG
jgi:large subunit ribosomal protein L25